LLQFLCVEIFEGIWDEGMFFGIWAGIGNLAKWLIALHSTQSIVYPDILPPPTTLPEEIR
jgi:hypothetical protein